MKKIILNLFLFVGLTQMSVAQKCKYKINEVDKFTNKFTKVTKSEKVIGTFYTSGEFSVKRVDTSYYFIFEYELSSYSKFDPYSIKQGAALIFLMESGDVITLNSADNIQGVKKNVYGIPPVYSCFLKNVSYPVTKTQLDLFFKSKVKSIRFYRTESNGKEDYIDNDIKKKNQDDIQELIKCVI